MPRDTTHMQDHKTTTELAGKTETDSDTEQTCGWQDGEGVGRGWCRRLDVDTNLVFEAELILVTHEFSIHKQATC